jgi:hypothetical protein
MDSLGVQFAKIIEKRMEKVIPLAVNPALTSIFTEMKANTSAGRAFKGQKYKNTYSESHSRARKRFGLSGNKPVVLRYKTRSIEQSSLPQTVDVATEGGIQKASEIGFMNQESGVIFKYHQTGKAKGGYVRKIFPEFWKEVPDFIRMKLNERITRVLNGG